MSRFVIDTSSVDRVDICIDGKVTLHFQHTPNRGAWCVGRTGHQRVTTTVSKSDFMMARRMANEEMGKCKDAQTARNELQDDEQPEYPMSADEVSARFELR